MHLPGEQVAGREIEADIAHGQIGAVAVGDVDASDLGAERHKAAKPFDGDREAGAASRPGNEAGEPILPRSRLQHAESRQHQKNRDGDGDAEPSRRGTHQNASPRLI